MKNLVILAGATLALAAAPAAAQPAHAKGHKPGAHAGHVGMVGCPPGLAKKNNGCLPPGQAKKLYNIGQRFPSGYGNLWSYNQIPVDLRTRYGLDPSSRYYYGDGYVYRVDPQTMLIREVISAILR